MTPAEPPKKQTMGTATVSHKMLTLQALSSSLNASTAKRGCLGRREAFGCHPAVCPPKRPRPFAPYRLDDDINSPRIFDVMHMKSLRKLIPPDFLDVMIT